MNPTHYELINVTRAIFIKYVSTKAYSVTQDDSFVINLLLDTPAIFNPKAVVRRCSVKKVFLKIS